MKTVDRRINKAVHYTITPINDLAMWKAEQARLQEEWDAGRAKRYEAAKERTVSTLLGERKSAFTLQEVQELAYRKVVSRDVVEYALRPDNTLVSSPVVATQSHKKTLFERAITYVKSVFSRS